MGRAHILCILALISRGDNDRDAFIEGIGDALLDVVVMPECGQAQVDDLCSLVHCVADAVSDHRRASAAGCIDDTHRKDLDIDPRCAVHNGSGHVCSMAVFVRGITVIVHKIFAGQNPALHFHMIGHTAVDNGNCDRLLCICFDKCGIFVRLDIGGAP